MNPTTLATIFGKCAAFWGISVSEVELEYEKGYFTIVEIAPSKYQIDHRSRPDFVIIIEDEP